MKTESQKTLLAPARFPQEEGPIWKSFVGRHWLLGHKVLEELKILIRLAEPKNGEINGHSVRRTASLRLKRT